MKLKKNYLGLLPPPSQKPSPKVQVNPSNLNMNKRKECNLIPCEVLWEKDGKELNKVPIVKEGTSQKYGHRVDENSSIIF